MNDLYVCTGPFHVFCCIFLKCIENRDRKGELCIVEYFESAVEIYEMVKKSDVFDKVFLMKRKDYEILLPNLVKTIPEKFARIIRRGVDYNKYRGFEMAEEIFDRIYIAGAVPSFNDFAIYQHNKYGAQVLLFDDGLGSRMQWETPKFKTKLFDYKGKHNFFSKVSGKYFFSTDKIIDTYPFCKVIEQCKPIAGEIVKKGLDYSDISEKVRRIFQYRKEDDFLLDIDALYLGGGYDMYRSLEEFFDTDIGIAEHCSEIIEKYAVKKHPDSKESYKDSVKTYNINWPLEVSFMFNDLENKILITSASAAVFNPIFIFDKEPYVILTYKLYKEGFVEKMFNYSCEELERRIKISLIDAYKRPEKICIPATYEELDEQINKYMFEIKRRNMK